MSLATNYSECGCHVARLRDSVVVMRTCPQTMRLVMVAMRKLTHGFLFLSNILFIIMGLRLVTLQAARAVRY